MRRCGWEPSKGTGSLLGRQGPPSILEISRDPNMNPLVIAHRGASAAFPENTVEAFEGASRLGADWVELDVRRTADGLLAVHHDARLGGGRAVVELPASALPASVPDL